MSSTFVLLHGAGSDSWYWHLVAPELARAGHDIIAVDLPVDDDSCGLAEYVATVADAVGARNDLAVVAQSMAAFTAPVFAAAAPVNLLVLVAPMVPSPGETAGAWWANTGQPQAARRYALSEGRDPDKPFHPFEMFLHDVEATVIAGSAEHARTQAERPFSDPWPLARWPDIPTRCVVGKRDRLFPLQFQRRVVRERLGVTPDEIDSGHLSALARPAELATLILDYAAHPSDP
jgi:pimeloyl-ACP methyl ester carboxylesterase